MPLLKRLGLTFEVSEESARGPADKHEKKNKQVYETYANIMGFLNDDVTM